MDVHADQRLLFAYLWSTVYVYNMYTDKINPIIYAIEAMLIARPRSIVGSISDSRARGHRFDTCPGHSFVSPSTVSSYWQNYVQ